MAKLLAQNKSTCHHLVTFATVAAMEIRYVCSCQEGGKKAHDFNRRSKYQPITANYFIWQNTFLTHYITPGRIYCQRKKGKKAY